MLNRIARAERGAIPEHEVREVERWLRELREEGAVLVFVPDTRQKFYFVNRGDDLFPPGHPERI